MLSPDRRTGEMDRPVTASVNFDKLFETIMRGSGIDVNTLHTCSFNLEQSKEAFEKPRKQ